MIDTGWGSRSCTRRAVISTARRGGQTAVTVLGQMNRGDQ
jgi:hypothetical protein